MSFIKYKFPAIAWFLVIFALCSMPGKVIPHVSWLELLSFDKFVHASIFFILQVLIMRAYYLTTENFKIIKWFILVFCVTYGGALELMQYYLFSQRSGDWFDFIANSLGCLCGLLLFNAIKKKLIFFR